MMTTEIRLIKQRGFSLVTAIFLLVVIAAIGTFAVTISTNQNQSDAMDVVGKRTYQAARAGIEWGAYQITQSAVAGTPFASQCQAGAAPTTIVPLTDPMLNNFNVSVTCAAVSALDPGTVWIYTLTSTASTAGAAGDPNYFNRSVSVNIAQ